MSGDIAEDGSKDQRVAPTNLYRYELKHCCSNGCVWGVRGSWNCTWTAFKSILDAARSHKILPFISYLLPERQKDREGGKKKKVGSDNSAECESWAIISNEGEEIKLQRSVMMCESLQAECVWTD